jgi:hypothetical protein
MYRKGDIPYGEDWGFNAMYQFLVKHTLGGNFGGPPALEAWESDPFMVSKFFDNYKCLHSSTQALIELDRGWGYEWSYDIGEVKVPCFLYCGKTEIQGEEYQKVNKKLVGDNAEIIAWDGAGHLTVGLGYTAILTALVKKEKASLPSL